MLKTLIVDDEYYFREALKVSIDWAGLGFYICGEAKNGKDALEKVENINPDVIIVDVNMPIMDGLEFVEAIKQRGYNCKIIILTGHSEFNYAKQAVQLGVNNYVLKPVDEEELIKCLLEIKALIEKELSTLIEFNSLKQQVKDSIPLLKEKFLNELLQGSFLNNEKELVDKMNYLNIKASEYYMVVTIELDLADDMLKNDEDFQLWKFAVSNITNEILGERFVFSMCFDSEDRICIILNLNDMEDCTNFSELLENRLDIIRALVYKHLDFTITIGVGTEKNKLFNIHTSYKESIVALKNKLTIGSNKVIMYTSVAESRIKGNIFTSEHRGQLMMNMRICNEDEVNKIVNEIFLKIRNENIHHEILFVVCIEMVAVCMEFIAEVGLSLANVLPNSNLNILEELQSKKSVDEIESWVKRFFRLTLEVVQKNKMSKASKLVEEVKHYIKDCYQDEELSVNEIAKNLFVNYAHLSYIFKRDTGVTINEYITDVRIKKAKELFDKGESLIIDVAAKVGYSDANYFGKCFKKRYGLAPSKYIDNRAK